MTGWEMPLLLRAIRLGRPEADIIRDWEGVRDQEVAEGPRARELGALPASGDLTQPAVAASLIETATKNFGRVDVLVNVAGGLTGIKGVIEAAPDVLDKEITINLKTAYVVSRR